MPKIKLLDNLIVGDGKALKAGSEIDTERYGIDPDSLENLLNWKAVEVIGESDPLPAPTKVKKTPAPAVITDPVSAEIAADPVQAAI